MARNHNSYFLHTHKRLCWNQICVGKQIFLGSFWLGIVLCFLTAVHLPPTRKGRLRQKVAHGLLFFFLRILRGNWEMRAPFESESEWEPTKLISFVSSEQAISQKQYLASEQQVRGKKEEATLLLYKGRCFGGGGQEFEIKHAEEKSARGKISSERCPLSLSDGIVDKVCFSTHPLYPI